MKYIVLYVCIGRRNGYLTMKQNEHQLSTSIMIYSVCIVMWKQYLTFPRILEPTPTSSATRSRKTWYRIPAKKKKAWHTTKKRKRGEEGHSYKNSRGSDAVQVRTSFLDSFFQIALRFELCSVGMTPWIEYIDVESYAAIAYHSFYRIHWKANKREVHAYKIFNFYFTVE